MHDTTLQAIGLEIESVGEHAELRIFTGLMLPTPQGPMPIPAGIYRVPMGRDSLIQHGKQMQEVGESLPEPKKPSGIVIANSLEGVDTAVQSDQKLRGQ